MNQEHISHLIDDYIDGNLNAEERAKVDSHLKVCSQCRKELSASESVVREMHRLPKAIAPPAELQEAITKTMLRYGTNHRSPRKRKTEIRDLFDYRLTIRLAAGFIVLIGAGVLLWYMLRDSGGAEKSVAQKTESQARLSSKYQDSNDTQREIHKTIAKNNTPPGSLE
jgi:anti-sigma factor RsiW